MEEGLSKFILYTAPSGAVRVDVFLEGETVWLTQKAMGELFGVVKSKISEHLTNIFKEQELDQNATVRNFRTVQKEGERLVNRDLEYYNLDAIISVGYRVNSNKATQFRIWATQTLKEYVVKGFVLDDERLKQGETLFGKDYFRELLQRVRSIRASERRIYQQVTDIFAECCIDYDKNAEITKGFYAMVQNKFHFAITGKTAANDRDLTKKEKQELPDEEKEYKSIRKQIQEKLIKFATRIPVFMYLTDYRERSLKDVITQLEPGLFKKVTGLYVKDFELLVSLGVFNSALMNDAVYKFKRYEDPSLSYSGINKHPEDTIGLYDTVISNEEFRHNPLIN